MIQLTQEESLWIDGQANILKEIETNRSQFSDEDVKNKFDYFYQTICSWRKKYNTKNLSNFWAFGVGYDGYRPGNNDNFIGLYRELMDLVEDKVLDKPIYGVETIDGKDVEIEEKEDGTRTILREVQ